MRRVGIVCGAGIVSGKEIMALGLAEGLRSRGFSVEVATSDWGDGEFARRLSAKGFTPHRMRLGFISASLDLECLRMTAVQGLYWPQLVRRYRHFAGLVASGPIVHTNWQHLLLLRPWLQPARDFFWVHDILPTTPRYGRLMRWLDARLAGFIVVSKAVGRSLEAAGIAPQRIQLVYNGIANPFGSALPVRAPLGIGIVGQVAPHKGHADLVRAFSMIAARIPSVDLHIFGAGPPEFEAELRREIESVGLGARVRWHGYEPDRRRVFGSFGVCAVPSRCDESFGLVAVEAGLAQQPVIAVRRGGLAEVVEDGITGVLIEPESGQALADALLTLVLDPERCRAMGVAGRERALTRFGEATFLDTFTRALQGPARG